MKRRERVHNAMHYRPVDKVPLQYYYTPVGYYEHGDRLNDLFARLPGDFEPFARQSVPVLPESCFDSQGNYHFFRVDDWGVEWEYRIYGVQGIPSRRPINSPDDIPGFRVPPAVKCAGPEYEAYTASVRQRQQEDYYTFGSGGSLYEQLLAIYGDENVLCDMQLDEPGINELADRIVERNLASVERSVKAGVDGISMGDDYGSERGMVMSPACWRRFIKPRLARMLKPAVDAGLDIHFHRCGQISPILEDLRELGVTSIWPQLPAYNMQELAERCRSLGLAVAIHTDRARTMTYGTPQDVRELVKREFDVFRMLEGGSWFYVEADNGFPFANIEALVETIAQWR